MKLTTLLALVAALTVIVGCSGGDPVEPAPAEDETSVFDPMTSTIERAKGVEEQVNQRVDDLNKRLEESEGQ
jgi:hypothetical protein